MTVNPNRDRLLRILMSLVILLFASITLSGCATNLLWDKHNIDKESVSEKAGKPEQLFVNQKENKVCISYIPNNYSNSNERKYLIAEVDKYFDLKILADIFSNPEIFHINSVVVNKQIHTKLNKEVNKNLNIYLFGDIPSTNFMFEDDTDNSLEISVKKIIDESKLDDEYIAAGKIGATVGHQDVLRMLVNKQWLNKFGTEIKAAVIPVAVIDKNGTLLSKNLKGANGILTKIHPIKNGIKYVKVMFDLDNYYMHIPYKSCSTEGYPEVMGKYKDMYPLNFIFGDSRGNECRVYPQAIKEIIIIDNFNIVHKEWSELPMNGKSFEFYENTMEQRNVHKYSLPIRIIGTPITVVADIVASPFYAVYIALFMIYGT